MKNQKELLVNNKIHLPQIPKQFCKVLITGSPKYNDQNALFKQLEKLLETKEKVCVVTSTYFTRSSEGKLQGIDTLAAEWSYRSKRSKQLVTFYPEEAFTPEELYIAMIDYVERAIIFTDGRDAKIANVIKLLKAKKKPNHFKIVSI